jgi:uncharacterized protein YdhG (YjbR/CyaY superfamily)
MKNDNVKPVLTVDDYIMGQPENFRKGLEELRTLVKKMVPGVEEMISYGVPVFKHHYMLVGLGAAKKHIGFYTMTTNFAERYKDELDGVKFSGTTLQLPPEGPFPIALIKKVIEDRVKDNEMRFVAKKGK